MPNWSSNYIEVRGTNSAKIQELVKAFNESALCQAVLPVPEELLETVAGSHNDPEAQLLLTKQTEANTEKFGYSNWYDFCTNEWGSKWDICEAELLHQDEDGLGFTGSFESAWSPPLGIVQELERQGFQVTLRYCEPGMCYVGIWTEGQDTYYEYGGMRSDVVRGIIGEDLDDHFGISESLFENEEDEEELTTWIKQGVEAREQNI